MNTKQFKDLIKEAIREELPLILMEYQQRPQTKFTSPSNNGEILEVRNSLKNKMANLFENNAPESPNLIKEEGVNPYLSLLQETANNMTAQDLVGLRNLG